MKKTKKKKHPYIGKHVLIMPSGNALNEQTVKDGIIEGLFNSAKAADEYMIAEVPAYFEVEAGMTQGEHKDWGPPMLVCKVVAVRRQIPILTVSAKMVDVESEVAK